MEKFNKKDLVVVLADEIGLSKREAEKTIDVLIEAIEEALKEGKEVNVSGFGVLSKRVKEERIGTDPKSHKQITIPKTNTVIFRPSKSLKSKLN